MKLYNFKRLIEKYSVTFHLRTAQEGRYEAGKWVEGTITTTEMRGAIVPLSERKVYGSGGAYTEKDRELYTTKQLATPLSALRVVYKGQVYSVESARNFEDYADVAVYVLKWQSKAVTEHA